MLKSTQPAPLLVLARYGAQNQLTKNKSHGVTPFGTTIPALRVTVTFGARRQVNADENGRFPEPTEPVASLCEIQSAGHAVNEGTNSVPHLITLPEDLERLKAARFEQSHNFGRNELSAIEVCHAYVQAQRQHVVRDRSGRSIMQYARKIRSTPGKRDGLYWDAKLGQEQSPFGLAMVKAHPEEYSKKNRTRDDAEGPVPFHGYFFKILTKQGRHAPGGKYDYILKGHLVAGFALLAALLALTPMAI